MSRPPPRALGGRALYEVSCPRCAHAFGVPERAASARCPRCGTDMDLVPETVASQLGIDPRRGVVPTPDTQRPSAQAPPSVPAWARAAYGHEERALRPVPPVEEVALVEIPCPVCEGPLLVSPNDREGICPHCERELEFEVQGDDGPYRADLDPAAPIRSQDAPLILVPSAPRTDAMPGPDADVPQPPIAAAPAREEERPDGATDPGGDAIRPGKKPAAKKRAPAKRSKKKVVKKRA